MKADLVKSRSKKGTNDARIGSYIGLSAAFEAALVRVTGLTQCWTLNSHFIAAVLLTRPI